MRVGSLAGWTLALGLWFSVSAAQASIVVVHQWNLGEQDAGNTIPGSAAATTVDAVGGANLTLTGAPTYASSGIPGGGSTHAVSFGNAYGPDHKGSATQYYSSDFDYNPTSATNWGIEAWVQFNSVPVNPPQQEAGIFQVGPSASGALALQTIFANDAISWAVHAPGKSLAAGTPVDVGQWTHVAVVNNNGSGELYINGTLAGSAGVGGLNPGAGLTIGAAVDGVGPGRIRGADAIIDTVRIFEFEAGQFNINDTLFQGVPVPEPTTGLMAMLGAAGVVTSRRRHAGKR